LRWAYRDDTEFAVLGLLFDPRFDSLHSNAPAHLRGWASVIGLNFALIRDLSLTYDNYRSTFFQ